LKTLLTTTRRMTVIVSGCVVIALTGCAEVTFKRGAGPEQMQATEQGCREKTATVEAYKACLNAAGFIYAKPSGDTVLFGDDEEAADAATADAAAADTGIATAVEEEPASIATDAAPTVSVEPSGRTGESLPQAKKPVAKAPADPLKKVTVASWWKFGGTADGLNADQATCASTLGEAHHVAPNAKVVTVGMLRCLKTKGWFAVGR
jgi:hypothetical protein